MQEDEENLEQGKIVTTWNCCSFEVVVLDSFSNPYTVKYFKISGRDLSVVNSWKLKTKKDNQGLFPFQQPFQNVFTFPLVKLVGFPVNKPVRIPAGFPF